MATVKTPKIPKTLKCRWNNTSGLAASVDGTFVLLAGENGQLARLDLDTWQLALWPELNGSVNSLAVSPDGAVVAIAVAGTPRVEVRDRSGAVRASIPTPRNVRVSWAPEGDLLVARLEANVNHPYDAVAFIDPKKESCSVVDLGAVDSVAACFVRGGETALAYARRKDLEHVEAHRVLEISRSGDIKDRGPTKFWDWFSSLAPLASGNVLLRGMNFGWQLVRISDLEVIAQGERAAAQAACVHAEGFVVASNKKVARYDGAGARQAEVVAKKRVEGVAVAGRFLLLYQDGQPAQIEIIQPS
jgi:hypothetical protein